MKNLLLLIFCISTLNGVAQSIERTLYNEKVYLTTDKDIYKSGETIRVKGFVVDSWEHIPLDVSKYLYIDLVALDDNILQSRKIRQDSLGFSTTFVVDTTMTTGNYFLRGYTNPMKYIDPEYIYTRQIIVDHAPRQEQPIISSNEILSSSKETILTFYAEGGNLVFNTPKRVVFKSNDKHGIPVVAEGLIMNQNGDTLNSVKTLYNGYGEFILAAKPNEKYYFESVDKKSFEIKLPIAPSIRVERENNNFKYKVDGLTEPHTLLIHSHGGVIATKNITPNQNYSIVDASKLKDGLLCFTLFKDNKAVSERVCYINTLKEEPFSISINNGQLTVTPKKTLKGDFVVSLTENNKLNNPILKSNIHSSITLQSELKNAIANIDYLTSENTPQNRTILDMILITQKWDRYVKYIDDRDRGYGKELNEFIYGTVSNKKVNYVTIISPSIDKLIEVNIDKENNSFYADLPDFEGEVNFYIQPNLKNEKSTSSEIDIMERNAPAVKNIIKPFASVRLTTVKESKTIKPQDRYNSTQINRAFKSEEGIMNIMGEEVKVTGRKRDTTIIETKEFYSNTYLAEDKILKYSNFDISAAVEQLMNVKVALDENGDYKVLNTRSGGNNMIIVVDGVITHSGSALRMSPLEIESIEKLSVAQGSYLYGSRSFGGVISIKTRSSIKNIDPKTIQSDGASIDKVGYYKNNISTHNNNFYTISEFKDSHKINTSLNSENQILKIEGITENGEPIIYMKEITLY